MTNDHSPSGLKHRDAFSPSSGAQRSGVAVSAGPCSLQRLQGRVLPASSSSRGLRVSGPEAASPQPLPRPSYRLLSSLRFNLPCPPLLRDGVWAQPAEPRPSPYLAVLNVSTSARTLFPNKAALVGSGAKSLDLPPGAAVSPPPTARPARGPPILALHPLLPGAPTPPHQALGVGLGSHGEGAYVPAYVPGRTSSEWSPGPPPGASMATATLKCPELELSPADGGRPPCRCATEGCGRPCRSGGRGARSCARPPAPVTPRHTSRAPLDAQLVGWARRLWGGTHEGGF